MDERNNLPKAWVWTRLDGVIGSVKGKKPKNLGAQSDSFTNPYINIEAFEKKIFAQFTDGNDSPLCEPNDILIVWDGARCGLVGRGVSGAIGSTLAKLICGEISPFYLFYFLKTQYEIINRRPKGVGIPHIDPNIFWNIQFPLAPLLEQQRIVAKIEELFSDLDAGIVALQKAKAQLKRYRQAVLKAAVEGRLTAEWRAAHRGEVEPASALLERIRAERAGNANAKARSLPRVDAAELPDLPAEWCWTLFDEILVELKNGYFYSRAKSEQSGIPILRISAVRRLSVSFDDLRYVQVDFGEVSQYQLQNGDLLFTRYNGSKDFVGACGLVRNLRGQLVYPDKLIRARVKPDCILPDYLELYFASQIGRSIIERKAKTTAGQYGISGGDLKSAPVALPPFAEQQQILAEVERRLSVADEIEETVDASLKQAERLRQSILKRAFAGKLVPQDPSDEPAEKLLERIKAQQESKKTISRQMALPMAEVKNQGRRKK